MQVHIPRRLVAVLVVMSSLASWPAAAADAAAYDAVIARVLKLLPRQPEKVTVVDAHATAGLSSERLHHVEAFVKHGERVVYLVSQGVTLQKALKGAGVFDYALATIIWHEMAHIDGADETKAQLEEEQLWQEYVLARRVNSARGMKYLTLLRKHTALASATRRSGPIRSAVRCDSDDGEFNVECVLDLDRSPDTHGSHAIVRLLHLKSTARRQRVRQELHVRRGPLTIRRHRAGSVVRRSGNRPRCRSASPRRPRSRKIQWSDSGRRRAPCRSASCAARQARRRQVLPCRSL